MIKIKPLLSLIILISFFSCNLEELPKAEVTKDAVFDSEEGLELYSNSFYEAFPNTTRVFSDESYYLAYNKVIQYLTPGGYGPEESSGWSWSQLRNINYFIDHCNSEKVSDEVKNNYIGIARFFRAYFYFKMMKRFGDLPWIDHSLDEDDPLLEAPRDDRAMIAEKIKADLDFA